MGAARGEGPRACCCQEEEEERPHRYVRVRRWRYCCGDGVCCCCSVRQCAASPAARASSCKDAAVLRVKRRITRYLSAVLRALARRNVDDSTEALRGGTSGKTLASLDVPYDSARLDWGRVVTYICRPLAMSSPPHESARLEASPSSFSLLPSPMAALRLHRHARRK